MSKGNVIPRKFQSIKIKMKVDTNCGIGEIINVSRNQYNELIGVRESDKENFLMSLSMLRIPEVVEILEIIK